MKDVFQQLLTVIALAAGAGITGGLLVAGLLSGALDGPARGRDSISFSEHPLGFSLMALLYLGITAGFATYAYRVAKRKPST